MTVMTGPCSWPNVAPACDANAEWAGFSPEIKAQALEYANYIVWTATGRQFGLCQLTVRPCGRQCQNCPSGWYWDGYGAWVPYIWNGQWLNCWCGGNGPGGGCTCDPKCQVYLPGPVNSIVSVQVDGAGLPVTGSDGSYNYFVLDQRWLVRTDTTACWPTCGDQDVAPGKTSDHSFEVTYLRGIPVPDALANATATLALEYAKACVGQPCRLPSRVQSISRQGVTVQMVNIEDVLKNGLTGIWELDQLIMAINPYGLRGATRFYSPDVREPRQVTWPD